MASNNYFCMWCGDDVPAARWLTGRQSCLFCGEEQARLERLSWTVAQQYQKGPYQLITANTALSVLHNTNQKNLRG